MIARLLPLCLVVAGAGYAQLPESPQAPPSPHAFSFMQVQKAPVSWYTGIPSIEVPLHEVQYKTQALKMQLSYNASGFKPDQHASPVGTGWALRTGGLVTRQVNGLPDEYSFTYVDAIHPGVSTQYDLGWLRRPVASPYYTYNIDFLTDGEYHWVDKAMGQSPTGAPEWVKYPWPLPYRPSYMGANCALVSRSYKFRFFQEEASSFYTGTKDVQRDEFSFNVFGYSGKFYFKDNSEVVVVADKKFKVSRIATDIPVPAALLAPNSDPQAGATCPQWMLGMSPYDVTNAYPKTIAGFSIQAEDGTTFYFGNHQVGQDAIEYSIGENYKPGQSGHGMQNYTDHWIANAWHLTSVQFPDGRIVCYDYQRGDYQRMIYRSELQVSVVQNSPSGCGNATSLPWPSPQTTAAKITSPVYLQRIYSDVMEATFSYSNTNESHALTANAVQTFRWKKLDTISIKDMTGQTYKWVFTYDPLSNWSQRLFLQKIERFDPANVSTGEQYLFQYNNHLTLPGYHLSQNDHWGYWNNAGTASIIGLTNAQIDVLRAPSLSHTLAGVLRRITYPTGGYRDLSFELNTFRKNVRYERMEGTDSLSSNYNTGGLRIAQIRTVDTVSGVQNIVKYYYVDGYDPTLSPGQLAALPSSGVRNVAEPVYHWSNVIGTFYVPLYPTCLQNLRFSIACQQPLQALHDDYHIGYSSVVEVRGDSAYTVRRFTNHDNGHADDSVIQSINPFASPYRHFSSRVRERGKVSFEGLYTKAGKLVKSTATDYVAVPAVGGGMAKTYLENWTNTILDSYNGNGQLTGWSGTPAGYVFSDLYKEYTYAYLPAKITTRQYQDNADHYLTTSTEYEYNNPAHWQPTLVRNVNSDGRIMEQLIRFPQDYPATFVIDRFVNNHWLNQPIEQINMYRDSATGPAKVTGALLNEFAIFPHFSAGPAVPMNTWSLQAESPVLLSSLTATVPVSYSYSGTDFSTAWTKDSRYKLEKFVARWDSMYNPLEVRTRDGLRRRTIMGYRGLLPLGVATIGESRFWHGSVTSFEVMTVREPFDYQTTKVIPDCNEWIYLGNRDSSVAFTGKYSFSGRVLMRQPPYLSATIDMAVRAGGNMPIIERYVSATNTFQQITSMTPVLLREVNGWRVYRYVFGNAGIQLCINTNGNLVDELRMGPSAKFIGFNTVTYVGNRQTQATDARYHRIHYEYDAVGRLIRLRDDAGNIVEEREFRFRTPVN